MRSMTLASGSISARRRSAATAARDPAPPVGAGDGDPVEIVAGFVHPTRQVDHAGIDSGIAGDVGLDPTRVDGGARDVRFLYLEFHPQRVGKAPHGELGRVVRRLRGDTEETEHAREVHDVTLVGVLSGGGGTPLVP